MTYDVLLALRGWGESDFRLVRPDFLQAIRFALFAERMAPELAAARSTLDVSMTGLSSAQKVAALKARMAAADQIKMLGPLVVPDA